MINTETSNGAVEKTAVINSDSTAATKAVKAKKEKASAGVKLTRFLAVGNRGTTFAALSSEQLALVKLNEYNGIFAKERLSGTQKLERNRGEIWEGVLWLDSASWISTRQIGKFWLGTLDQAVKAKIVRKAIATIDGKKHTVYVRGEGARSIGGAFDASKKWGTHSKFANEENTRFELGQVKNENGKGLRNKAWLRRIEKIELV